MIQRAAVSALLCLMLFARGASAHPMHHERSLALPVQPPTLQQILDGLVVSGPPIDASAPLDVDLWTNSTAAITAQLVVSNTSDSQGVLLRIYDPGNASNKAFARPHSVR